MKSLLKGKKSEIKNRIMMTSGDEDSVPEFQVWGNNDDFEFIDLQKAFSKPRTIDWGELELFIKKLINNGAVKIELKHPHPTFEFDHYTIWERGNQTTLAEDKVKGGKADKMSPKDIADKFGVPTSKIEKEIRMGKKVEGEHTHSQSMAKEIAMDHLTEFPDYYTRLEKMEKEADKHWKEKMVKEDIKSFIKTLIRENLS